MLTTCTPSAILVNFDIKIWGCKILLYCFPLNRGHPCYRVTFHCTSCYCIVHVKVSFVFVTVFFVMIVLFFNGSESVHVFLLFVYICIIMRHPYHQEGKCWDYNNRFNTDTFLCLSRDRIWILSDIYHGLFLCVFNLTSCYCRLILLFHLLFFITSLLSLFNPHWRSVAKVCI